MVRLSSWRALGAAVLGGCIFGAPARAAADVAPSRLQLEYDAPAGCPSSSAFRAELETRIDASWWRGADARTFDVHVQRAADGSFTGTLTIGSTGRASNRREVRASTCRAVTTAIAVFVAIALDPATAAPEAEPEPAPSPTPPSPSTDGARAPNETRPPAPARVLAERRKALAALWTIAARVDLVHLRAPEPAWGGRVGAELVRTRSGERLAPALRLSWGWVDFSKVPPRAGEADFRLRTTRAEGCLRVDLAPFVVSGCAGVELGSLRARISEIPSSAPPQATRWVAAVAEIRAGLQVLPWLAIEAETGVLVPFERTSFALISPPRLVYRAPAVLFSGGVGLGVVARFR